MADRDKDVPTLFDALKDDEEEDVPVDAADHGGEE
jgi:hypothetical protein